MTTKLAANLAFVQCIIYSIVMREVNIGSLDLNLLFVLKALLDERHVTRAADKVGLSQPAMSRALQRLRVMFKDPLLVKSPGGMTLTARANDLYHPLQNILNEISHIITAPTVEPSEMHGEVVIATRDYEMAAILPEVISRVANEAPGLTLRIVPMVGDDLSPLERNEVDFVVAGTDRSSSILLRKTLLKDNFICVLSAENPAARQQLTLQRYLDMKHCLVSFTDLYRPGIVDKYLAEQGLARRAVVRVPQFLAAPHIVANSDLVVTLPRRLGLQLAQQKHLVARELPFKVPSFTIYLYWHVRNQTNPMHSWLRKMFRE